MSLTIKDIVEAVGAEVLAGREGLDNEIGCAIAADLVSDILCCPDDRAFLITGLATIQLVRAAEMIDLAGVLFVRGKTPTPEMVEYAANMGLPLLLTNRTMYQTCGMIYQLGIKSGAYVPPSAKKT